MSPSQSQFNQEEFDLAYPEGIEHHYWNISRNFFILNFLKKRGLTNDPILEIGCGKGIVVAYLRKNNLNCWGVELADVQPINEAAAFVKMNTNATSLDITFTKEIKTIMFLDVLEHVENPTLFVNEILTYYPNVKNLIITVPARQEIWSNYDEFYRHYRRYNIPMVKQTMSELNFHVNYCHYLFHSLYLLAKIKFYYAHHRPIRNSAPTGIMKIMHWLIACYLIMEGLMLPGKTPGSSILCLATKK
jgi:hypothetical protein